MKDLQIYQNQTSYGMCIDVDPYTPESTALLDILETIIDDCHMPDCGEKAVRVGVFESTNRTSHTRLASEFRGLCERHKQMGMWSNAEKAWGWD